MKNNTQIPGKEPSGFIKKLLINLCIMLAVGLALIFVVLLWLDSWTDHGKYEIVPSVAGLNYYEASDRLKSEGFNVELSDSVFDSSRQPGTVLDQNPQSGAKVKHGREIYLTINAFSPKTVKLPQIIDVSERQARAMLLGVGLKNITTIPVESAYKGLVVGARSGGKNIQPGVKLSVTSPIVLEVGAGIVEESSDNDEAPAESEETSMDLDL